MTLLLAQRAHALEHRRPRRSRWPRRARHRAARRAAGRSGCGRAAARRGRPRLGSYPRSAGLRSRSPTLSAARDGRHSACALVDSLPLLLVLASSPLVATGCFESKVAGHASPARSRSAQGTTRRRVNPAGASGTSATSDDRRATTETASPRRDASGEPRRRRPPARRSGADVAAGKAAFAATCGGCHTLKDAGTSGNVGPDLDSLAPLRSRPSRSRSRTAAGRCRPKLLTGQDAANVAAYVASVAGK